MYQTCPFVNQGWKQGRRICFWWHGTHTTKKHSTKPRFHLVPFMKKKQNLVRLCYQYVNTSQVRHKGHTVSVSSYPTLYMTFSSPICLTRWKFIWFYQVSYSRVAILHKKYPKFSSVIIHQWNPTLPPTATPMNFLEHQFHLQPKKVYVCSLLHSPVTVSAHSYSCVSANGGTSIAFFGQICVYNTQNINSSDGSTVVCSVQN